MGKGANTKSGLQPLNSEFSLTKLRKVWIENNLDRPFDGGGSAAAGGVGPTGSNSGGANEVLVGHTVHRDEYVFSSPSSPFLDALNSANNSHIFSSYSANYFKSSGEMVPLFTNAQWTELERQAMIYKYMVSSVPVPPHLLHPSYALYNNVGYSKSEALLLESGRCKRTDGKKWRCSRDVAPHQKYCERHLHRGRPRSRKPVEINNNNNQNNGDENHKKPRLQQTPKQFITPVANDEQPLLLFNAKTNLSTISTIPSHMGNNNRDPGLMMESEMIGMNGALLELSNMGFDGSSIYGSNAIFHDQDYIDHHVLSYSNYPETPVGLIDQNVNIESMDHESFNPSLNLSIAMAGGNVFDEETGNARTREGANFNDEGGGWLSPVYWEQFGPGGPLAEALLRNPASPHDSISGPTATAVSSPSGVIQRMFSNSDSSVCNSPSRLHVG